MAKIPSAKLKEVNEQLELYYDGLSAVFGIDQKKAISVMRGIRLMSNASKLPDISYDECILIAGQGARLGFSIVESFQYIWIYNGKLSLHSESGKALVMRSGLCEAFDSGYNEEEEYGYCTVKRKGMPPHTAKFYFKDIPSALKNRDTWKKYPKRMCEYRATWYALKNIFPDVLCGLSSIEEQEEIAYSRVDVTPHTIEDIGADDILTELKESTVEQKAIEEIKSEPIPMEVGDMVTVDKDGVRKEAILTDKFELGIEE